MQVRIVVNTKKRYSWAHLRKCHEVVFYIGSLTYEGFMPVDSWSLDDYSYQWRHGFEKIKIEDKSCIVIELSLRKYTVSIFWYLFYKKGSKVIVQKLREHDDARLFFQNQLKITPENCYELIPEYKQYYPIIGGMERVCWELSSEQFANLKISITSHRVRKVVRYNCIRARISFEGFSKLINIPVNYWSIADYKQQWQEGIARLQQCESSCLITRVVDAPYPMVERWLMYKRENRIFMYFDYVMGMDYRDEIGDVAITLDNWYQFIPLEEEHLKKYKVDEWEFDVSDFDDLEIEFIENGITRFEFE